MWQIAQDKKEISFTVQQGIVVRHLVIMLNKRGQVETGARFINVAAPSYPAIQKDLNRGGTDINVAPV